MVPSMVWRARSFSTLEPNEVGIEYDSVAERLNEDRLYESGRYFLGVGRSFFKYPKALQTVTALDLGVRSNDGLFIAVDISFSYRITSNIANLVSLYLNFGELNEVQDLYIRIAKSAVRDAAATFSAFAFITNRTAVATEMETRLNAGIEGFQGSSQTFQLLNFTFPAGLEASINRQAQAQEDAQQALENLARAEVDAAGVVTRAPDQAELVLQAARADATEIVQNNEAAVFQITNVTQAEGESYALLAEGLGLEDSQLLSFMWLDTLTAAQAANRTMQVVLNTPPIVSAVLDDSMF